MRITLLLALLLLSLPGGAPACLNFSDVTLDGNLTHSAGDMLSYSRINLSRHTEAKVWQEQGEKLLAKAKAHPPTVLEMSDYGVVLAHLGQYKDALQVLDAAEQKEPGHSSIASNLGTVYELLGDNEKARTWIAIGLKRNPKDHDGTEWLHLKILDAKLALAKDPNWLMTHSLLGPEYEHGTDAVPKTALKGGPALADALGYQLQERLEFVKAPEPIVGELLFMLADEIALASGARVAADLYDFAATYKPVRAELLKLRAAHVNGLLKAANLKPVPPTLPKP
jgi:tetratricopeptide (TPR) repeat protein